MSTEIATTSQANLLEKVIAEGDLSRLTPEERMSYYRAVCESVGLNPLTQPLGYLKLNGKLTLYALKGATDQLRKINHVSVISLDAKNTGGLYIVTCHVKDESGRTDASTGAVAVEGLRGDALANAIMKTETKAKRRATLSICGLGLLDESEVETIRDAHPTKVSHAEQPSAPTTNGKHAATPREEQVNQLRDFVFRSPTTGILNFRAAQVVKDAKPPMNDAEKAVIQSARDAKAAELESMTAEQQVKALEAMIPTATLSNLGEVKAAVWETPGIEDTDRYRMQVSVLKRTAALVNVAGLDKLENTTVREWSATWEDSQGDVDDILQAIQERREKLMPVGEPVAV